MKENKKFKQINQKEITFNFFLNSPDRGISHAEVVDSITNEYEKITNKKFKDPDRQIRSLYQQGLLFKVSTGIYKLNPDWDSIQKVNLNFSEKQKKEILKTEIINVLFVVKKPLKEKRFT